MSKANKNGDCQVIVDSLSNIFRLTVSYERRLEQIRVDLFSMPVFTPESAWYHLTGGRQINECLLTEGSIGRFMDEQSMTLPGQNLQE